jgi:hypothetical protein
VVSKQLAQRVANYILVFLIKARKFCVLAGMMEKLLTIDYLITPIFPKTVFFPSSRM